MLVDADLRLSAYEWWVVRADGRGGYGDEVGPWWKGCAATTRARERCG